MEAPGGPKNSTFNPEVLGSKRRTLEVYGVPMVLSTANFANTLGKQGPQGENLDEI
jgi:hypothetical protein